MPSDFLRSWDPVTLIFDTPRGPAGGGPADDPGSLFVIDPAPAGEFRWVDQKTLQFLPADPWPPLERIMVRSGGWEQVLRTLMSPPIRVSPRPGATNLNPITRIEMTLAEPVAPARLAEMLEITLSPLPGLENQPVRRVGSDGFTLRFTESRPGSSEVTVSLELDEAIPYGVSAELALRLTEGSVTDASVARYRFSTRPLFSLTDMGGGSYRLPVGAGGSVYGVDRAVMLSNSSIPLYLQFSEPLDSLSMEEVRRLVSFDPAVSNFRYEVRGNRLFLYVNTDSQTPYRMIINHEPVLSSAGRVLAPFGPSGFSFYTQRLPSFIRWDRGDAVVERFGPKVFPMQARGVSQVDLRLYRIDPLDRRFWPFGNNSLAINEESRPPMPGEPVDTRERAVRTLGSPQVSTIISLPMEEKSPSASFGLDLAASLRAVDGVDAPGTYLAGYRALGSDPNRHYVRVVVTDLNLTVVEEEHQVAFFVTSLSTGAPLKGAEIRVEAQESNREEYVSVIRGTTDAAGRFVYPHTAAIDMPLRRLVVSKDGDTLVFDPASPPPTFRNNHWYGTSSRWLSWLGREPVTRREAPVYRGYLISERPIYRPEEKVYLLGYLRSRQAGAIGADTREAERRVDVTGPGGRTWTYPAEPDGFGQFTLTFEEEDVPTGEYTARLYDNSEGGTLSQTSFKIESYRIPRFEVQIHGEEKVPVDDPFDLELTASYYAGGMVSSRPVSWRVTETPFYPRPVGFEGFTFSSYQSISGGYSGRSSGLSRQDVTDENGRAVLTVDPGARQNPTAVRYLVEGTVEGADGQRVTAVKAVQALPPFSVGIRQERFVRNVQKLEPEVVILDFNGKPLAGKDYTLRIYQRQWHSYLAESDFVTGQAEYRSDVVDELILEEEYRSGPGPRRFAFDMEESGVYIIEVLSRDGLGRLQSVRVDSYIPGTSPVSWERTEGNVFETTSDKDAYQPGDTARILIQSPFQEARALAVVEGPEEIRYEWVDIKGGQGVFELPVQARMVPRLPVHFLLFRGRVPGTANRYAPDYDRGRPMSLANTTWLDVLPVEHQLNLELKYPPRSLPGKTVTMEIFLTDSAGRGADGQVALWLVDRAVLSLAEEKKIDPLSAFIDPVEASVTLRDTRNQVVGNLPYRENPGGGGWDESASREADLLDKTTIRRNFKTVPYYNPRIPVKNGKAVVEITLPDNLTDFAVRAVAVSGFSRFGTASGLMSIRLPVIVQTALPRFVRPGDQFTAGGVARVVEGEGGPVRIQVKTTGMTLAGGGTERTRMDRLDRGAASRQYFDFLVPPALTDHEVTITLGAERTADGASDAFEARLPVKTGVEDERRSLIVRPEPGGSVNFPVEGPFRPGTLRQDLTAATNRNSLYLLGSRAFLDAMEPQTTEQWTGKLKTALLLKDLLDQAGSGGTASVDQRQWEAYLSYLKTVVTPSGLYAQFPGGRGLVSVTAWILDLLVLAEEAGLETEGEVKNRLIRTLQEALRSDFSYLISGYSFQERVEALSALGRAGYFDHSYGQSLLAGAAGQNLYASALLASSFLEQGQGKDRQVQSLVGSLKDAVVFRLEGGVRYVSGLSYRASVWGGYLMTSQTRTLAAVLKALVLADPSDPGLEPLSDYLLRRGSGNGWGSTADTVEAVGALLTLAARQTAGSGAQGRYSLFFGSREVVFDAQGGLFAGYASDIQTPGRVVQTRPQGPGPWLSLTARYRSDIPLSQWEARNNGFVVNREFQIVEDDRIVKRVGATGTLELATGTVMEEHITLSNPEDRHYVALRVPLAAGCEPLNPNLDTSGAEAVSLGSLTRPPTYARYLDDEVVYYYEELPAGTYHFYFRERAVISGTFQLPPALARALYEPETEGNSSGAQMKISGD